MESFEGFLAMGGYATWVWSAWGLSLAVVLVLEWDSRRRLTHAEQRARRAAGEGA